VSIQHQVESRKKTQSEETLARLRGIGTGGMAGVALQRIQAHAEALLDDMQEIHGGRWSIVINHRTCYVLVARDGD
jgi:hypothetical protein